MKFICKSSQFKEAVNTTAGAADNSTTALPLHRVVRVTVEDSTATFEASRRELPSVGIRMPVTNAENGRAAIPSALLAKILTTLGEDDVTCELKGNDVHISTGGAKFKVRTYELPDWPATPQPTPGEGLKVEGASLAAAIRQVIPFAAKKDDRPILQGVYVTANEQDGGMTMVATDSFRMAFRAVPETRLISSGEAIIPAEALAKALKIFGDVDEIEVNLNENTVRLFTQHRWIEATLMDGQYPKVLGLIPKVDRTATFNRERFITALNRAAITTAEVKRVELSLTTNELTVRSKSDDGESTDSFEIEWDGEPITVGYHVEHLRASVDSIEGENLFFGFPEQYEKNPALLTGEDENHRTIVMPIGPHA